MSPEQFTYWLRGFFEISDTNNLSEKQVQIIRDHLNLVFNKVTPDRKDDNMGYKPLDTRFTGTNNNPLCKQEIDWRDNPNFKQIKEETKYC
jgi:hypothetical protein